MKTDRRSNREKGPSYTTETGQRPPLTDAHRQRISDGHKRRRLALIDLGKRLAARSKRGRIHKRSLASYMNLDQFLKFAEDEFYE